MEARAISALLLVASLQPAGGFTVGFSDGLSACRRRQVSVEMMGRKFENNKLKMAKTVCEALACARTHAHTHAHAHAHAHTHARTHARTRTWVQMCLDEMMHVYLCLDM